ncbi:hypothetical protein, partial [Enterococcus faecalis]|uniref:hypothetical protein n=1 Tax=Enterococcus faecalis TaxID=1351 RepID=UPI0022F08557
LVLIPFKNNLSEGTRKEIVVVVVVVDWLSFFLSQLGSIRLQHFSSEDTVEFFFSFPCRRSFLARSLFFRSMPFISISNHAGSRL